MFERHRQNILLFLSVVFLLCFILLGWGVSSSQNSFSHSIHSFDSSIQSFVFLHSSPLFIKAMLITTHCADPVTVVILLSSLTLILVLLQELFLASFFLGSLAIGMGLSTYVKNMLERPRPLEILVDVSRIGYAYPSGHSLIGIVFYGFLGYCLVHVARKRWQKTSIVIITILTVFFIGYSRIALGVHWPSDVVGGWLLGGFILTILIVLFHLSEKKLVRRKTASHFIILLVMLIVIVTIAFLASYFYVTHAFIVRSILKGP